MADILPPIPYDRPQTSFEWIDWYTKLNFAVNNTGIHNLLQGLQGGAANDYYHLTQIQFDGLTDGDFTTLHQHEFIPVDGVYISVVSTNPSVTLGYGTWLLLGTGTI